jgi:uncharacterized protein YegP (UPF0339 family)
MKFVVKKTSNGQFRFNLVASNGQVVATSETYARKQSALDTIASIQKNAGTATLDDETLPNRRPTPGQHGFAPATPHRPRGALERRPPGHRCPPRRLLRCQPDGAATTHPRVSHGEHQKGPRRVRHRREYAPPPHTTASTTPFRTDRRTPLASLGDSR